MLDEVELPGTGAGSGFDLGTGYGGLVLRVWHPLRPGITGEAGLLVGAGKAEVRNRFSGLEEGSDNFLAAEPEISISFSPLRGLFLGVSGGFRLVWGVEDLPLVREDDLRSFTLGVSVRLGGG
jgi:hypothetical protein